jgi:hypothetical protein
MKNSPPERVILKAKVIWNNTLVKGRLVNRVMPGGLVWETDMKRVVCWWLIS